MTSRYLEYQWFKVKTVGELKESLKLVPDDMEIGSLELRLITNLDSKRTTLQHRTSDE